MTFPPTLAGALAAALGATTLAVSAHAQTFNPDNSPVSGVATSPAISYEGTNVVCDTGTLDGNTGSDSGVIPDVALAFSGNCSVEGTFDAEVFCAGDTTLWANDAIGNWATIELNGGFRCDIVTDLCTISIEGPQATHSMSVQLRGEGTGDPKLDVNTGDLQATRDKDGSELCGPEEGTGSFLLAYDLTPHTLIDRSVATLGHGSPRGRYTTREVHRLRTQNV